MVNGRLVGSSEDLLSGHSDDPIRLLVVYYHGAPSRLRVVREGQFGGFNTSTTTASSGQRFIDNNNGTVTDTRTNLIWLKNANPCEKYPYLNWYDAVAYCTSLPGSIKQINKPPFKLRVVKK